jgi:hypothetical protein
MKTFDFLIILKQKKIFIFLINYFKIFNLVVIIHYIDHLVIYKVHLDNFHHQRNKDNMKL